MVDTGDPFEDGATRDDGRRSGYRRSPAPPARRLAVRHPTGTIVGAGMALYTV
jgi:hypothetical protein